MKRMSSFYSLRISCMYIICFDQICPLFSPVHYFPCYLPHLPSNFMCFFVNLLNSFFFFCYQYMNGYVAIQWSIDNLLGATLLKNTDSSSFNNYQF